MNSVLKALETQTRIAAALLDLRDMTHNERAQALDHLDWDTLHRDYTAALDTLEYERSFEVERDDTPIDTPYGQYKAEIEASLAYNDYRQAQGFTMDDLSYEEWKAQRSGCDERKAA